MNFKINHHHKYHYIRVNEKTPMKHIIARIDVSHLNKKGINSKWDEIDAAYPINKYISCLESTNKELPCFENDPKLT